MTIALANKNRQAGSRMGGCKNGEVSGETVYKRLQTSKKLKVVTDEDRFSRVVLCRYQMYLKHRKQTQEAHRGEQVGL